MPVDVLKQGAEARLYLGDYKGERCLVKERFVKQYRHPDLDTQITRQRIKAETKAAARCQAIDVRTPRILHSDLNERKIYMEYFDRAITAKQYILELMAASGGNFTDEMETLCKRLAKGINAMHANNIIHGDLTTSNVLINPIEDDNPSGERKYELIFIDFGLSQYSEANEAKGVDLYVLERAILSTHSELPQLFERILAAYRSHQELEGVLAKLEEVRARGRKRTMIG